MSVLIRYVDINLSIAMSRTVKPLHVEPFANGQSRIPTGGSWPLANIRMANALKTRAYDFHFSFGKGTHNDGQGAAEFPKSMTWLWRNYDPAKTEETYTPSPAEKDQPFFRVSITNRGAE